MIHSDKPILVVITIKSTGNAPFFSVNGGIVQSVIFRGESTERAACFEITHLLDPTLMHLCRTLEQHGFTVAELPLDWRHGYQTSLNWQNKVIESALERIGKQYEVTEGVDRMTEYDPEFASEVLVKVNEHFPIPVQIHESKHSFDNEPSDDRLLMALDGLLGDGLIEGKPMYESTSSQRKLAIMANIKMTQEGRRNLSAVPSQTDTGAPTIIQGNQFNNYGMAGAIGPHSIGTINYQQPWGSNSESG